MKGKFHAGILAAVLAVFAALGCLFAGVLSEGRAYCPVDCGYSYSFVIRDCEAAASVAVGKEVYGAGGAGYATDDGVIVACYFRETDAERAAAMLSERNISARAEKRRGERFALEGARVKEREGICGLLSSADTCARLLFDTANGLERGTLGQEEARAAVRGVAMSLRSLAAGEYPRWNADLLPIARAAETHAAGILFAKDLRLLQVKLCLAVLSAPAYFA